MIHYYVYNEASGRVLRGGACPIEMLEVQAGVGEIAVEGRYDDAAHYHDLDDDSPRRRPIMPLEYGPTWLAVNQDFHVSGIPENTRILYANGEATINDGELDWTSTVAGMFTLVFTNFPYQEEAINVTFTDE